MDPLLWRLAADAPGRIERAASAGLGDSQASAGELWIVAELAGQIVGLTHAMLVPVPPIYDSAAGTPGLLLDDCIRNGRSPARHDRGCAESGRRAAPDRILFGGWALASAL